MIKCARYYWWVSNLGQNLRKKSRFQGPKRVNSSSALNGLIRRLAIDEVRLPKRVRPTEEFQIKLRLPLRVQETSQNQPSSTRPKNTPGPTREVKYVRHFEQNQQRRSKHHVISNHISPREHNSSKKKKWLKLAFQERDPAKISPCSDVKRRNPAPLHHRWPYSVKERIILHSN